MTSGRGERSSCDWCTRRVFMYDQWWSVSCFQPVVDQATLEEYLQVERELGEARRADPQVLSQLELKTEALDKMTQKVERLERHYGDLEALA